MKIAVLDSDPDQARLVCQVLASNGHTSLTSANGKEFLAQMERENVDMLIMDWQLPDLSGIDVVQAVRERLHSNAPILLIVGRADEDNLVAALNAGANDYQVKPLRRSELSLRTQALLKRAYPGQQAAETVQFGSYAFEPQTGLLNIDGISIDLTQKEFTLALLFFRNLGRPLSRAYIQEKVWSREAEIPSRTMDTHVSRVRNKLRLRPENGFRLIPVYSYGYRLEQLTG